jgi:pimeloyl-ACP methyl ester carboxylesterase
MSAPLSANAEDRYMDVPAGHIAYRSFGNGDGVPLVLFNRFRATMDHWDPDLLDVLARERHVIIFDNAGIGLSSGDPADTVAGMAQVAASFITGLGHEQVDVLGWSLGGAVAQRLALDEPKLVRRLVLAGTSPGLVPGAQPMPEKVLQVSTKPRNDDEDFLYLFFADSHNSRRLGLESLRRIDRRLTVSQSTITPAGVKAQLTAFGAWGAGQDAAFERLADITVPTFVGNGFQDIMVDVYKSYVMAQRLRDAQLILYPDSGHAFLFQHAQLFGGHVLEFLR